MFDEHTITGGRITLFGRSRKIIIDQDTRTLTVHDIGAEQAGDIVRLLRVAESRLGGRPLGESPLAERDAPGHPQETETPDTAAETPARPATVRPAFHPAAAQAPAPTETVVAAPQSADAPEPTAAPDSADDAAPADDAATVASTAPAGKKTTRRRGAGKKRSSRKLSPPRTDVDGTVGAEAELAASIANAVDPDQIPQVDDEGKAKLADAGAKMEAAAAKVNDTSTPAVDPWPAVGDTYEDQIVQTRKDLDDGLHTVLGLADGTMVKVHTTGKEVHRMGPMLNADESPAGKPAAKESEPTAAVSEGDVIAFDDLPMDIQNATKVRDVLNYLTETTGQNGPAVYASAMQMVETHKAFARVKDPERRVRNILESWDLTLE